MEITYSIFEIEKAAQQILKELNSNTLLFYGPMGAGKTTLIKALIKELGSKDEVSSPTFSIVNEYESPLKPIFHFDFYRIEDPTEALDIGIEDYFSQDAWIFIEWPQKIENFLPEKANILTISVETENIRKLKLC